jgi:hypothetical protein
VPNESDTLQLKFNVCNITTAPGQNSHNVGTALVASDHLPLVGDFRWENGDGLAAGG